VLVPDVLGDIRASDDVSCAARQVFEQRVFAAGEGNLRAAAPDAASREIDREMTDLDALRRQRTAVAARQGPDAREELAEVERLGEVIVGAGVEALHARLDSVARGQHQHRHV